MLALLIGLTAALRLLALGMGVCVLGPPPLVRPPGRVHPLGPPMKVPQTLGREAAKETLG